MIQYVVTPFSLVEPFAANQETSQTRRISARPEHDLLSCPVDAKKLDLPSRNRLGAARSNVIAPKSSDGAKPVDGADAAGMMESAVRRGLRERLNARGTAWKVATCKDIEVRTIKGRVRERENFIRSLPTAVKKLFHEYDEKTEPLANAGTDKRNPSMPPQW